MSAQIVVLALTKAYRILVCAMQMTAGQVSAGINIYMYAIWVLSLWKTRLSF